MSNDNMPPPHDWSGTSGDNWVIHQQRLDAMLDGLGKAAIAAANPQPGEMVIDVGCGAGTTSFALADRVGAAGEVLGVDISPQLVARAQADTPPKLPVTFRVADAATALLPTGAFDLLFSRFGIMFFDDPVPAFAHMRAALKSGGRLAFVCWRGAQENDWVRLPMTAIRHLVTPVPVDPLAPGPFAFGDPARVTAILTAAGFANIVIAPFDTQLPYGHGMTRDEAVEDALAMSFAVGPLSRALADQPEDVREQAVAAVREALAGQPGDTSVLLEGAAWIVTAQNPGNARNGTTEA